MSASSWSEIGATVREDVRGCIMYRWNHVSWIKTKEYSLTKKCTKLQTVDTVEQNKQKPL